MSAAPLSIQQRLEAAAERICEASAVLIVAGAGMSADSGLPTYRGKEGFWRAYPPLRDLGLDFEGLCTPKWWEEEKDGGMPRVSWGFQAHLMQVFFRPPPHEGYHILKEWMLGGSNGSANSPPPLCKDFFIKTTNIDAMFERAGFPRDRIYEEHGTLQKLQCWTCFCNAAHRAKERERAAEEKKEEDDSKPEMTKDEEENFLIPTPESYFTKDGLPYDEATMTVTEATIPRCKVCNSILRPNVVLFDDDHFVPCDNDQDFGRFSEWLEETEDEYIEQDGSDGEPEIAVVQTPRSKLVILEIGAGPAVQKVRVFSEGQVRRFSDSTLIRIGPEADTEQPPAEGTPHILLPLTALEALKGINAALQQQGGSE